MERLQKLQATIVPTYYLWQVKLTNACLQKLCKNDYFIDLFFKSKHQIMAY